MEIFILGGYSRSSKFRKTIRDFDEGKLTCIEYYTSLIEDLAYLCGVQDGSNMTIIQDPQIDFHDIFRPFVESWRGVYYDGLLRYFDNNFFYRIPVFVEEPDIQRCVISTRCRLLKKFIHYKPVKISVPGPITFVNMSKTDLDKVELAYSISRLYILDVEIGGIKPEFLQIDEPYIADPDFDEKFLDVLDGCIRELKKVYNRVILSIYFNVPKSSVLKRIFDTSVDLVCISFVEYTDRAFQVLRDVKPEGSRLGLGIIDGRDIKCEDYEYVKKIVDKVLEIVSDRKIGALTTSSSFELIPLEYAIEKTRLLGRYGLRILEELSKS